MQKRAAPINAPKPGSAEDVCIQASIKEFDQCFKERQDGESPQDLSDRCNKKRKESEQRCLNVEVQDGAVVDGGVAREKDSQCAVAGNRAFASCMKDRFRPKPTTTPETRESRDIRLRKEEDRGQRGADDATEQKAPTQLGDVPKSEEAVKECAQPPKLESQDSVDGQDSAKQQFDKQQDVSPPKDEESTQKQNPVKPEASAAPGQGSTPPQQPPATNLDQCLPEARKVEQQCEAPASLPCFVRTVTAHTECLVKLQRSGNVKDECLKKVGEVVKECISQSKTYRTCISEGSKAYNKACSN